jgi:exopolyphosphatase/pppGpp-phosphohydrolase
VVLKRDESISTKEVAARQYARRQLQSIEHERRVCAIADALFTRTAPLHRLTSRHRRLLRLAALLHDVGRRFGDKDHPVRGAEMIARDRRWLLLTTRQRRALVYLTRYHRGAVPNLGYDGILRRRDGRKELLLVLALLRMADSLDNRQLESPHILISQRGRKLSIACMIDSADELTRARKVFRRRKKLRLLEELLDITIDVEVRSAALVASH